MLHKRVNDLDFEASLVNGNSSETGQIIVTSIGGRDGKPKKTFSYMAERVVGTGSFGVLFEVNKGTASASEILAGSLKDNKRAVLIGEPTFGKGKIQSVFELSDGSGLAVTVARYETPDYFDINKVGIIPDHTLPTSFRKDNDSSCGCI